jgi:putative hemolysin
MELLFLLLLTLLNGLFSMSEMAVVSSRKARLQHLAEEGRRGAQVALALAESPSSFLATVQIGITVIGIASGAFGEATLVQGLSEWLSQWQLFERHSRGIALTIVISGITLASVILGELVPKRLALLNPEAVASLVSRPMRLLATFTAPVVQALGALTDGILNSLGLRAAASPPVTEEEIRVLMEQGAEAGVFEEHEPRMVERVFRLADLRVAGVMTPRGDMVYLDLDDPLESNVQRIVQSGHSRFPVVRGGLRDIRGIALAKTLLDDALAGRPFVLENLVKPLFVPQTITVMDLVASFRKHRQTAALVVNEFGDTIGLVTLNDVMEALVGDVATVEDEGERDIVQRDERSWLIDGGVTIERFKDVLQVDDALPEEGIGIYHTLAGFAMLQLDRVPKVGDRFDWSDLTFEVVDMDANRVDRLLVTRAPGTPAPE